MAMASLARKAGRTTNTFPPEPPVSRHEAVWLAGKVPSGYWDKAANRRKYLRWLGQELGFRKPEDWYRLTTDHLKQNRGGGLLLNCWHSSAIYGVKECFPEHDWKDWLFRYCPRSFWKDDRNHRAYMKWLGQRLGIRKPGDWYNVTNNDFTRNKGGAFLLHYRSSVSAAVMAYLPNHDWTPWCFKKIPKGLWKSRQNRRRYMDWLARQLDLKGPDGWYSVTQKDFLRHCGNNFLKLYGGSPCLAVMDVYRNRTWNEWMFARVPVGYWQKKENRKRYMNWLSRKLGMKKPGDWTRIRKSDFVNNYGGGLLAMMHSYSILVDEYLLSNRPKRRQRPNGRTARLRPASA